MNGRFRHDPHRLPTPGLWLLASALLAGLVLMLPAQATGQETPGEDPDAAAESVATDPDHVAETKATARLLLRLGEVPSPTGDEAPLRDVVQSELLAAGTVSSVDVDRHGNLFVDTGTIAAPAVGKGRLLFLMALDDPTYAVSAITDAGWLRVVPVARPPLTPMFHRRMVGAEVWVMAAGGAVPGLVAIPSIHLQGGRAGFPPAASADHLFIDTGADVPGENGATVLDRIVARGNPQVLAGRSVAGFGIAQRAPLAAAIRATRRGISVAPLVLLAQSRFAGRGAVAARPLLEAWAASGGGLVFLQAVESAAVDGAIEVVPVRRPAPAVAAQSAAAEGSAVRDEAAEVAAASAQAQRVAERLAGRGRDVPVHVVGAVDADRAWPTVDAPMTLVRFPVARRDSLAETIDLDVVLSLSRALERTDGAGTSNRSGGHAADAAWRRPARLFPADQRRAFAHLPALIRVPGVSGSETAVRDTVRGLLPRRFDEQATVDDAGNLVIDLGSGSPHLLFVAHLDETGYRVTAIEADGRLAVERRGGFYDSALVGRMMHVHTPGGIVPGVLVEDPAPVAAPAPADANSTRATAAAPVLVERLPVETLRVDVGTRSADATAGLGVAVGDSITVPKQFRRLGNHRGFGRAIDDRAGSAALIAALHRLGSAAGDARDDIVPDDFLDDEGRPAAGRLTFAWVTREEIGLEGATVLAARLAPDAVFAVDTFVSADSPLEDDRFGLAPLGEGAVLRALDSSSLSPRAAVRAVLAGAREAGITVQTGAGRGGNDGSVFVRHDAPDLPLSWPGRYSHSAIEVIDERDHESLVDLVLWLILHTETVLEPAS